MTRAKAAEEKHKTDELAAKEAEKLHKKTQRKVRAEKVG
jgi:hypothetical protein